ncbi:cytochrome c [Bradyrhizobium sp. ARR65]|uniref:c-type cytochrome n=1 Tax=Bradyrhizobium sp. ARR65 TaxID=1040989 RepID=UPI000463A2DC|nr:cytochrome c [Bradyrhizobium sp. ARR65]
MRRSNAKALPHAALATIALLVLLRGQGTRAEDDGPVLKSRTFSSGYRFVEMSGEELYVNVCRGCHMGDALGATGAGAYPSLASDRNLEASGYAVDLVVNGRRGMPSFADMMSDDQIAAVVNYLRTHFGNNYQDAVTPADVHGARR